MARQDGGAAFPRQGYYPDTTNCGRDIDSLRERLDVLTTPQAGMSLRDWFAGQALIAFVVAQCVSGVGMEEAAAGYNQPAKPEVAATQAYAYADAMIARRG